MDLLAERGRRVSVDELNTTRLLAHARKQAVQRKFDDVSLPPALSLPLPRHPRHPLGATHACPKRRRPRSRRG